MEQISLKGVYDFLMSDILRTEIQNPANDDPSNPADWPLTPLKCELASPNTDWPRSWRLVRQRGLDPDLTSFSLSVLWGILPTRARLNRMMPITNPSPNCLLCGPDRVPETLHHALGPVRPIKDFLIDPCSSYGSTNQVPSNNNC